MIKPQKRGWRKFLVIGLVLLSFIILSQSVLAVSCCTNYNTFGCKDYELDRCAEEQGTFYADKLCNTIGDCQEVCCYYEGLYSNYDWVTNGTCNLKNGNILTSVTNEGDCKGKATCQNRLCDAPVINCYCGTELVESNSYCCAQSSDIFSNQNECKIECEGIQKFKVQGQVIDSTNGSGIVSNVTLLGTLLKTSNTGNFTFTGISTKRYSILASKEGYVSNYNDNNDNDEVIVEGKDANNTIIPLNRYIEPEIQEPECGDEIVNQDWEKCDVFGCLSHQYCFQCICKDKPLNHDNTVGDCDIIKEVRPFLHGLEVKSNSNEVRLIWTTGCDSNDFYVLKCETEIGEEDCDPSIYTERLTEKSFIDQIEPEKKYCYSVRASYKTEIGSIERDSLNMRCIEDSGDKECFRERTEFCQNNTGYSCNDNNKKEIVEDGECDNHESCQVVSNKATCIKQDECQYCNGLFGMFSKNARLFWETGNNYCDNLGTCYQDYSTTTVNEYLKCQNTNCYDYKSKRSCQENKCNMEECEWKEDNFLSLGVGVCRPLAQEEQNCSICNKVENKIFGSCENTCELYAGEASESSCYYTNECKPKSDVGCENYKTEQECTGFEELEIDVLWEQIGDSPFKRKVSGYNSIIYESQDKFGFGKCRWIQLDPETPSNICIKDADLDNNTDCDNSLDIQCQSDNTPPTTVIVNPGIIGKDLKLNISIFDNTYSENKIDTYYSLNLPGDFIYPNLTLANNIIQDEHSIINHTGEDYILYYYSEDPSKNIEEIKTLPLFIDAISPSVNIETSINSELRPIGNKNVYVSILTLNIETNDDYSKEDVICRGNLFNISWSNKPNTIYAPNNIDYSKGPWQRTYYDLKDGDYYYNYTCYDSAGNKNSSEDNGNKYDDYFKISINEDKSIVVRKPTYPNKFSNTKNVRLEVETAENATCRYSKNSFNFESGILFDTTNNITHTEDINIAAYTNKTFRYYVKCKFANEIIKGDEADIIEFAIDEVPPKIEVLDKYGNNFDFTKYYPNRVAVTYICKDPSLFELGRDWSFDGCTIYHSECGNVDCDPSNTGTNTLVKYYSNSANIVYDAKDAGKNAIGKVTKQIKIDNQSAELNITVTDIFSNKVLTMKEGRYYIFISSSKELNKVNEVYFKVAGQNLYADKIYLTNLSSAIAQFTITNEGILRNKEIDVTFYITVEDHHGIEGNKFIGEHSISIDTKIPSGPELEPALNTIAKKVNNKHYTNYSNFYISGHTDESDEELYNIKYYLNNNLTTEYQQQGTTKHGELSISRKVSDNQFALAEDRTQLFDHRKYVKFSGYLRTEYPNYKKFYKIVSSESDGGEPGETTVTLEDNFETAPQSGVSVTIYNKPYSSHWFTQYVNLNSGDNYLYLTVEDSNGNPSESTSPFNVFLDQSPPEIIYESHKNREVLNTKEFKVRIRDHKTSGIDSGETSLFVDDVSVSYKPKKISDPENEDYDILEIKYPFVEDGNYKVKLITQDFAKNRLIKEWNFKIDNAVPNKPEFILSNAILHNDRYFVQNIDDSTGEITNNTERDGTYSTSSNGGNYKYYYTVDRTPPEFIVDYKSETLSNIILDIKSLASNEDHDLNGTITINNSVYPLTSISNNNYNYLWSVPNTNKTLPFFIKLTDKAGNTDNFSSEIKINNKIPKVEITNITADKIIKLSETKYKIKDSDKSITIEGTFNFESGRLNLKSLFIEKDIALSQGTFNETIKLVSSDGVEVDNYLDFTAYDWENNIILEKQFIIVSDKAPPEKPVIIIG